MAESGVDSMTKQRDIDNLLDNFAKSSYSAKGGDVTGLLVLNTCLELFAKDYVYTVINNSQGSLCNHYPSKLVVLDYEHDSSATKDGRYQPLMDRRRVEELMRHSRVARCWTRFVAPVILYKGKHVCRSATLAGWQELFGRRGMDMVLSGGTQTNGRSTSSSDDIQSSTGGSQQVFDRHRGRDIQLLEELDIGYICDLMVEMKKAKYGFNISSSEKVDKENRYKDFSVLALPYPGCEFFTNWKESGYNSQHIYYDWTQELNTSLLDLQKDPILTSLHIPWENYKDWDLVTLTQNYLKALLQLLEQGSAGVLVHCISGWDRTPLFVSLLRLSLWADGAIHKSLPPSDILYLTLAYDWYLFGHGLPDRLSKGQEIMYFCFKMLYHISRKEFSVKPESSSSQQQESPNHQSSPGSGRRNSPANMGVGGLRHQDSNVSLNSNTSVGSDGMQYLMDTTQDEDDITPLGFDGGPSPQRSRHASNSSTEDPSPSPAYRGRQARLGSGGVDLHRCRRQYSPIATERHRRPSGGGWRGQSPEATGSEHGTPRAGPSLLDQFEGGTSPHSPSSPVNVPSHAAQHQNSFVASPSLGSWVDVGLPQMTPPSFIDRPRHAQASMMNSSIHSCHEPDEGVEPLPLNSRARRLAAVAQMFEEAYFKAVLSRPARHQGGLSSLFGNVAEKMGFRSGPR